MLFHRERCYNFANIKPWAAQLAQGRCKWHHLRLETRRHPVSRRRAPATPAKNSAPSRLPPPRRPAAEFPLKPMGVGSPKIWRSNEMKTSEQRIMFIIFHHGSSFFYQHLESLFLSHVASKDSAQTFASGPENIDERRKGHCGNSSFQQWPFRQRFPERFALVWWLLISVDCWCHGFAAATLKWGDLEKMHGGDEHPFTSVYHFFQCSLGYQGCDPYPYGGFLK